MTKKSAKKLKLGKRLNFSSKKEQEMEKKKKKNRIIKFLSKKNNCMIVVHNREAKKYAKMLEDNPEVTKYESLIELDTHQYEHINSIDIRKEYFETEWLSDFLVYYENGEKEIRELIRYDALFKQATVEKLEFSHRYWSNTTVSNWKIIILKESV